MSDEVTPKEVRLLDKEFWDSQWQSKNTGWDMGQVSPPIKAYIDQLHSKDMRILIPGCGNSYEAEYLLESGFTNVTLVDISPTLTNALKERLGEKYHGKVRILCLDFFDLSEKFDLILEQTFFCALDPAWRHKYVDKMAELLDSGGQLVGLLFDTTFPFTGPPFGGSSKDYQTLFAPYFEFKTFDPAYNSYPKRSGTELFINLVKK